MGCEKVIFIKKEGAPKDIPIFLLIHRRQELLVRLGHSHLLLEELHSLDGGHLREVFAHHPRAIHNLAREKQILAACTRRNDIDGGIDALVREFAVELELHITRTLELLEDNLIHL